MHPPLVERSSGIVMTQTAHRAHLRVDQRAKVEFGHLSWPASIFPVPAITCMVRKWLTPVHLSPGAVDGLVCSTGEAARNAAEHAYAPTDKDATVEVMFWTEADAVCVQVVDHGRWRIPPLDLPGRGIPLMRRSVDSVAIHYCSRGTQVLLCSHQRW